MSIIVVILAACFDIRRVSRLSRFLRGTAGTRQQQGGGNGCDCYESEMSHVRPPLISR
jgi:hypothetical protein